MVAGTYHDVEIIRIALKKAYRTYFPRFSVLLSGKTPGSAKIVFCSGSADGWILFIPIQIELHFPFSVPVAFQRSQCHICPNILSPAFYVIQYYVILTFFCYSLPSPLSMKISGVFRKFIRQTIINLVKECRNRLIALIFNGDFSFFRKGIGK